MKNLALFCVLPSALGAAPVAAQTGTQWDAATHFAQTSPPQIGNERTLTRTPLFDDAPFLRLRQDDHLVQGHLYHRLNKSGPYYERTPSVFLRSKGRLFDLDTEISQGHLELKRFELSVFFDWDVSLPNAARLNDFKHHEREAISLAHFAAIKKAVSASFPEAVRDNSTPRISAPALVGPKNARRAVFEALFYDGLEPRSLYKLRLEIGSGLYRITTRPFLVGPPQIERAQWDEKARTDDVVNGQIYGPIDPSKRAAYDKMRAFDALMAKLLARQS